MKQITIKLIIINILSLAIFFTLLNEAEPQPIYVASDHKLKENQINIFTEEDLSDTILINKLNNKKEENAKGDIVIYDIPLSEELQQYIWDKADEHNLNYELVLGVIYAESTFREDVISYNGTSVGLMQINQFDTLAWLSSMVSIENVDPFNPYHSVKMGTWYLDYLRNYWLDRGISEEKSMKAAMISYHRGLNGAKKYIKNNGYNSNYVNKIYNYKNKLKEEVMP